MSEPGSGGAGGGPIIAPTASASGVASASTYYQSFLEKMRHPSAAELVKAIKSFITTFRDTSIEERASDNGTVEAFLKQTEASILAHPLWKNASQSELENVREVLEKHLMTKIYDKSFCQTEDEKQKDAFITKKIFTVQFIEPKHLDIPERLFSHELQPSWALAGKELLKVNSYKAPRDKLVCILNCCKVIYNLLSVSAAQTGDAFGADDFLPLLIYVIIRSNPDKLHSNLEYISRYRNPEKMVSETMYFFTNMVCAVQFVEGLSAESLSMEAEEFHSKMAEREKEYEEVQARASSDNGDGAPVAGAGDAVAVEGGSMPVETADAVLNKVWSAVPQEITAWLAEHQNSKAHLFRFRAVDAGSIKISEVPELLQDYQKLVAVVEALMMSGPLPPSKV